jgi:hypothetical protein
MLDTLREGLVTWANARAEGETKSRAREAAATVGRAARALLAGFSLRASLPLGFASGEIAFDPGAVMAAFDEPQARDEPSSFYHASFVAMRDAVGEFVDGGARRVVIFIDDLDRCLPASALEVLESMKLFFDLEGFVFVVGLDQQVIERAVEVKYRVGSDAATNGRSQSATTPSTPVVDGATIDGALYIKKIFQVSLGLPRISTDQLDEFFDKLLAGGSLSPNQQTNFDQRVRGHLPYLTGNAPVNPREVKRLLNAYTIQLKMLSARGVLALDPDVVLALQVIGFRRDWQDVYDRLTTEPALVIDEIRALASPAGAEAATRIPGELVDYVTQAAPGLLNQPLEPYISSARSVGESDIGLIEAQTQIARLLRRLDELEPGPKIASDHSQLLGGVSRVQGELQRLSSSATGRSALADAAELENALKRLDPKISEEDLDVWRSETRALLNRIDDAFRVLRRQTSVRAVA